MLTRAFVLTLILLSGCGRESFVATTITETRSCRTTPVAGGVEIDCGEGAVLIQNGTNGVDGLNSAATIMTGFAPGCAAGGSTLFVSQDSNSDGQANAGDVNLQSTEICNGADGQDGQDGSASAFTPVGLLDPCGDASNIIDEIFLKLANGTVIASFSENDNGKNTRFSVIPPNLTARTTDGDRCDFRINASGSFTYESHQY